MKLRIGAVSSHLVDIVWDQVVPHLERVVKVAHGEITLDSVKDQLIKGDALLITISDGPDIIAVNTLEVRNLSSGLKVLYIPITGGDRMDEWMDEFLKVAQAVAKDFNCTRLRGLAVRKGWMRVLKQHDWHEVHTVIECNLERE